MLHNISKEIVPLVALIGGGYLCFVKPEFRDACLPIISGIVAWSMKPSAT